MSISNDEIIQAIIEIHKDFKTHLEKENALLLRAQELMNIQGEVEHVRLRVAFVNTLMEEAADRKKLRHAIIEKSTIGAVYAILVYLVYLIGNDLKDIIHGWVIHGGK